MNAFEYAAPTTKEQAVSLLSTQWGETEILAGGTDLLSLMKDHLTTPKRVVNIKDIKELQGIKYNASTGLRLGASGNSGRAAGKCNCEEGVSCLGPSCGRSLQSADPQHGNGWW